jgi:hypothetical protein
MVFLFGITASTFAWFKINSNASISGFEFTVQGGEGYQISIDGETYQRDLSHEQMIMAIIKGFRPNYVIHNNQIYANPTYNDSGEITDYGNSMTIEEQEETFKSILLKPLSPTTEADGSLVFRNYIQNEIQPTSGQFLEFSIYFKALGNSEDNQSYSVYVLGEDLINDITGESALKTSIKTKTTGEFANKNVITLRADMDAISNLNTSVPFEQREVVTYGPGRTNSSITVYTANAIRFSIGNENDDEHKSDTDYECSNQIYEISDDVAYDLGSYATDYDEYINDSTRNTSGAVYSDLEHNLYDCDSNEKYTYYNNLIATAQIPMEYEKMPKTIRHLTTVSENSSENSQYKDTLHYITTVKSGEAAHKLTFRFWLEGYDADCFDQISQSIRVNLSFGSVKND